MSRPATPDSPMSNSLHHATSTIDDLTLALSNFSRTASPEPPNISVCCCGREDCEMTRAWSAYKVKMESRLVLSAEVGQALLERHEAYVRRHESAKRPSQAQAGTTKSPEEQVHARVAELVKENAVLEKRLTQALLNNELAETSTKSSLQELEEARAHIGRLTAQQARSIGWENRLAIALQEKDDFQQERDSAAQRAKLAEARISALKEKCAKLQAQANRLREDFEMQRLHRHALSEDVLKDARQRLEQLQQSTLGHTVMVEDVEVTKVLESLVADNEALKRDNAELQNLLTESREDLHSLQEEVEERRASETYKRHRYTNSGQSFRSSRSQLSPVFHVGTAPSASVLHSAHPGAQFSRRAISSERPSRRAFEPLTPETDQPPLSPTDSLTPSDTKWTSFARSEDPASHTSSDVDHEGQQDGRPAPPEKPRAQRSLYLLRQSRGVQTDGIWSPSSLLPPLSDSTSSSTPPSESSSLTDGQSTAMGALVERVNMLLARLTQADALTLTNRLKRQHLQGADVSHLSRTTVSSVLHEASTIRAHFRAFLEDDKVTTTCTRRDLRGLLKLFKDMFAEMGQMRVTLNDVILDPSVAVKVSDMALHPAKAGSAETARGDASRNASAPSWMAPFSKLLGLPGGTTHPDSAATRALSPPARPGSRGRLPSRIVPKREAALSASAMTVNVEFSGTAVGRSVTSTYSAHPVREDSISILANQTILAQPPPPPNPARSVMGIFAGAPRPEEGADPWIVIPRPQRGTTMPAIPAVTVTNAPGPARTTLGRSALRRASTLSRTVDAVIDSQGQGDAGSGLDAVPNTLLERTLSRRGLSDSSLHTTFMSHGEEHGAREGDGAPPSEHDRQSVFSAISRRMQNFRFAGPGGPADADVVPADSRPETPVSAARGPEGAHTPKRSSSPRAIPQAAGILHTLNLSSWAASALDPSQDATSSYYAGSPREDGFMHRGWNREREL